MSNKYSNYIRPNHKVNIEERLIPLGSANRPGKKQIPKYIVIHEVSLGLGKSTKNYNMKHYENLILNQGKMGIETSYHFLIGDKKIYKFINDDEIAYHTSTAKGNISIGIERLICEGINYEHALHNQAKLAATLMVKWNIPLDNVKTHKGIIWTFDPERENKKGCPSRMLAGQRGGEEKFKREIIKCFKHKWFFYELLTPNQSEIINNIIDKELYSTYHIETTFPPQKNKIKCKKR